MAKKLITPLMIVAGLLMSFVFTSCGDDDEPKPGSNRSHDYYYAYDPVGEFYWVIDMDEQDPNLQYDNTFTIRAWNKKGKIIQSMKAYSGKYNLGTGSHAGIIYVGWSHQSMNTTWSVFDNELHMDSGNPEELSEYIFYHGIPSFEK